MNISELVKRFDSVAAVDGVSAAFASGSRTVLLGPSGCGKTTLLRCIGGLERPDAGAITLGGQQIVAMHKGVYTPPHKRQMGMVFQSYALWPHMTVAANVGYPLKVRRVRKSEIASRVEQALDLVRLEGLESRYPGQISGGQQQRVALARAIIDNPEVLLLDEPLSNLDVKLRERMRLEILELQAKIRTTMIHVTHDHVEAMVLAETLVVMSDGKLIQVGSPEDIYLRPNSEFVADFMDAGNLMHGTVTAQDRDSLWVTTDAGLEVRAQLTHRTGLEVGSRTLVCIRKDAFEVHEASAYMQSAEQNNWSGVITASSFAGDSRAYRVEADGIKFELRQARNIAPRSRGDRVSLSVALSDIYLLALGTVEQGMAPAGRSTGGVDNELVGTGRPDLQTRVGRLGGE